MPSERVHSLLEAEEALSENLFCTVHGVRSGRLVTLYSSHPFPERLGSWQDLTKGIVGEAVTESRIVRVDDVRHSTNYARVYPDVISELAVPVLDGKIVTGVVNFESTYHAFFNEANIANFLRLAKKLADHFYFPLSAKSQVLVVPDSELLGPRKVEARIIVSGISASLLAALSRNPDLIHSLSSRNFEKLIARLLADQGYSVQLTPAQKDGGVDVIARLDLPTGPILTLVECKKYSAKNPVSVGIVRGLYGVLGARNATNAMIATTSYFTKNARAEQGSFQYRMSLVDFGEIKNWLRPYFNFYEATDEPRNHKHRP
jgi:HJR/Mrr/RecB family endonuclease